MTNSSGITVKVLGDYGPFSRIGKSIGYQVTIGGSCYLVDCGSPVFQKFGGHGLKTIKGLIITHCHDDHKRWFSDFALFNRYAPDVDHKLFLMTSEKVNSGLIDASVPALSMSLAPDCREVIDIPYSDYVDFMSIAPLARYRIERVYEAPGLSRLTVVDRAGNYLPPDRAKIFLGTSGVPRMLFRDPPSGEWVEPESYYPFSSDVFYDSSFRPYRDSEGFTVEAINAPVWHGVPSIGVKFTTGSETLIFSADTNHDLELWQQLYQEKIPQRRKIGDDEFERSSVLCGDINDYIERIWSEARYNDAVSTFDNGITIHDIAVRKSVVHTDYRRLHQTTLDRKRTILTHSPDKMTSEWLLSEAEKEFHINGESLCEIVRGETVPVIGDFYHKENGRYFVCFINPEGKYSIIENDAELGLSTDQFKTGEFLTHVDIYEDFQGCYLPMLTSDEDNYLLRPDRKIELVRFSAQGSIGTIVEDQRPRLTAEFIARTRNIVP
ncbi:MAG: MBL fold metallo-hydrolase [Geobacteraceae bacterium]|nr:MBL fold metallo-hydrolase [Geobacteraceae bacterium]